jgi:hypothetical protein
VLSRTERSPDGGGRPPAPFLPPAVKLRTLEVTTFRTAIGSGSLFWMNVAAVPFLLTLVFQNVFGWSPVKSGALVLFVFVGNIAIKPATTAAVVLVATAAALRLHPDAGSPVSRRASPSPESA